MYLINIPIPLRNGFLAALWREFDATSIVDNRCQTPIEEIRVVVDGTISKEQTITLKQYLEHIDERNSAFQK